MELENFKLVFPMLDVYPAKLFEQDSPNLFWICVDGARFSSGKLVVDYFNKTKKYPKGLNIRFFNFLKKNNLGFVFYDPGTLMIFKTD